MAKAPTIRFPDPVQHRKPTDPVTSMDLGRRLCAIFGLDANRTMAITLALDTVDVARVTVEQLVTRSQADELVDLATTYGLHRAEPVRALSPGFAIRDTNAGE